jgi:hypothetical protein
MPSGIAHPDRLVVLRLYRLFAAADRRFGLIYRILYFPLQTA